MDNTTKPNLPQGVKGYLVFQISKTNYGFCQELKNYSNWVITIWALRRKWETMVMIIELFLLYGVAEVALVGCLWSLCCFLTSWLVGKSQTAATEYWVGARGQQGVVGWCLSADRCREVQGTPWGGRAGPTSRGSSRHTSQGHQGNSSPGHQAPPWGWGWLPMCALALPLVWVSLVWASWLHCQSRRNSALLSDFHL